MIFSSEKNDHLHVFRRWMLKQTADIQNDDEGSTKQHLQMLREMQNRSALRLAWDRIVDTIENKVA